jgi:hypothetical protein
MTELWVETKRVKPLRQTLYQTPSEPDALPLTLLAIFLSAVLRRSPTCVTLSPLGALALGTDPSWRDDSLRDKSAFRATLVSFRVDERGDEASEAGRSFNSFHPSSWTAISSTLKSSYRLWMSARYFCSMRYPRSETWTGPQSALP